MKRTADIIPFRPARTSPHVAGQQHRTTRHFQAPWLEVLFLPHDEPAAAARWRRGLSTLTALYGLELQFTYGPLCTASILAPQGAPSSIVRHGVIAWLIEEPQVRVLREQVAGGEQRIWVVGHATLMEDGSHE